MTTPSPKPRHRPPPILSLQHVSASRFGGVQALEDVSVLESARRGALHRRRERQRQEHADQGHHRRLSGRPGRRIDYRGQRVAGHVARARADRGLARSSGRTWRSFNEMTVAENIAHRGGRSARCRGSSIIAPCARPRRASLARLGADLDRRRAARQASPMAQRQIVAIARALGARCAAHLHGRAHRLAHAAPRRTVCSTSSARFPRQGVAVVFVSHRLAEVLEISSRVTVLRDGRLVGVFPTRGHDTVAADRADDRQDASTRRSAARDAAPRRSSLERRRLDAARRISRTSRFDHPQGRDRSV